MCKPLQTQTFVHQEFHGLHLGTFVGFSNPHISKITNFTFSQKLPTKAFTYAVVHRQPWPCAKPSEPKTFVHHEYNGIHLGTFVGISNPRISKTTNFIFSQNSPPSNLPMPWCINNLGHVQTLLNSKFSCTKNFLLFIWGHL